MSDYWEDQKKQPNVKTWLESYGGSMHCSCDHGCNGWLKQNESKAYLIIRILTTPNATTNPDKIAQMHVKMVDKIWYRIISWDSEKFNRELNALTKKEKNE